LRVGQSGKKGKKKSYLIVIKGGHVSLSTRGGGGKGREEKGRQDTAGRSSGKRKRGEGRSDLHNALEGRARTFLTLDAGE